MHSLNSRDAYKYATEWVLVINSKVYRTEDIVYYRNQQQYSQSGPDMNRNETRDQIIRDLKAMNMCTFARTIHWINQMKMIQCRYNFNGKYYYIVFIIKTLSSSRHKHHIPSIDDGSIISSLKSCRQHCQTELLTFILCFLSSDSSLSIVAYINHRPTSWLHYLHTLHYTCTLAAQWSCALDLRGLIPSHSL